MWNIFKGKFDYETNTKKRIKQEVREIVESISYDDMRRMMRKAWNETLGDNPRYKYTGLI